MRNGDIIDEFVSELCIGRLSSVDASDLIVRGTDEVDVALLNSTREALKGRRQSIAGFVARGLMSAAEADESLVEIATELEEISDRIALAVRESPLAELLGVDDVRAWWENATLGRRRLIIGELMSVNIKPVGHGRRVTTLDGVANTVSIDWKVL